ncbi:MAG: cofactor-independent phosphoglycerate mutase [Candidatus Schekmanbacteria bacterium]|nr:cofactor-independent phosphoglycerate mutase [Candidatus Schekmanbacteria bacterium]
MKYLIVLGDGMADVALPELGGKTPLEAANIPNMDFIAKNGTSGMARTIPDGMNPGSDVASLSVLGYNPAEVYTGRAPLEAASIGVNLSPNDTALRCNLVTIADGKMDDYSAGHIGTDEASILINDINSKLSDSTTSFYPGKSYRHLMVSKRKFNGVKLVPPHDISGQAVSGYMPGGDGSDELKVIMEKASKILKDHDVNRKRIARGDKPATDIWLWGEGTRPAVSPFRDKYGLDGAVISAVDLVNGIGIYLGFEVVNVPGATGYIDTNYEGKAENALKALKKVDIVYLHIEAPDETGHNGDLKNKIKSMEDIDLKVLKRIIAEMPQFGEYRILVMSDHPTPVKLRTHTSDPVNFSLYGTGVKANGASAFSEKEALSTKFFFSDGYKLMGYFLGKNG